MWITKPLGKVYAPRFLSAASGRIVEIYPQCGHGFGLGLPRVAFLRWAGAFSTIQAPHLIGETVMQNIASKLLARACLIIASVVVLSGCAYWVKDKEQVLTSSGFQSQPANTPERQSKLASLPAHEFVRTMQGTKVTYTWSDPVVCNCLWIGSDENYRTYRTVLRSRSGPTASRTSSYTPGSDGWQAPVSHGFGLP